MTETIAIDWSGRASGASESIWRACARDGRLYELENGFDRDAITAWLIERRHSAEGLIVGLDFAFSLPRWFCEREGYRTARAVWEGIRDRGDELLESCAHPFWGKAGSRAPTDVERLRETDHDLTKRFGARPKSVFQIGGAGAVGTGSIRGMPHLLRLADAGFSIWPFDRQQGSPCVVEIYPRLFTRGVIKSRHLERRKHLERYLAEQDPILLERAAGSEDAFDAAVSVLEMSARLPELEALTQAAADAPAMIEGEIWTPHVTSSRIT